MQLIRHIYNLNNKSEGCVATIGNFDGVHLGHQKVLHKIITQSGLVNLPSMVITFEPTAEEFFLKEHAPTRLTNFREKFSQIRELGIDKFVCLQFNHALSSMPAESFIKNVLVDALRIKHLTVGDNFRFGKDRKGDFSLLQKYADKFSYEVNDTESYNHKDLRVSSTLIREYLANGALMRAKEMLGRDYSMSGRVIHGDRNGRKIGFPTANIPIKRKKSAVKGVFAVDVMMENDELFQGVANIGHRPTVGGLRTQIEVHLFKFSEDIYGKHLTVTFRKKLRDEKKFDSFDDLKKQIQLDSESAQTYFGLAA